MTQEEYNYIRNDQFFDFDSWIDDEDSVEVHLTDGKVIENKVNTLDFMLEEKYLWIATEKENYIIPPSMIKYFKVVNKLPIKKEINW